MDWDHDICLSCDRQTADGEKFCSQACRLADLERAGQSEPATPSSLPSQGPAWSTWQLPTGNSTSRPQFQLAPAVNFSAYKTTNASNLESPPASPRSRMPARQNSTSYFSQPSQSYAQPSTRGLTQSPSRSSLSSISSSTTSSTVTTPGALSEHALSQLRDYSGAFDTVRDWKRRVTLG